MASFPNELRDEWKALLFRLGVGRPGGFKTILVNVAIILLFGVLFPYEKGLDFPDPAIITAYACLGLLLAAPAASQACADRPPQTWNAVLSRIFVAVIYGEIMALAMLAGGITTFNVAHWQGQFMTPDFPTLGPALALGLAGSVAMAAIAAWIALRFSAGAARGAMRVIFLGLLAVFFFYSRSLPEMSGKLALIALALDVAILGALYARMRSAE
jgi:hypothetical protein